MKQAKMGTLFLTAVFFAKGIFAQSIEDGKNFLFKERYKSAKEVFQNLLTANPNNDEAAYWMGQMLLAPEDRSEKDIKDAKIMYQQKLTANANSPLLMVGIGHIELIEGKTQDARNHFEAAISLSQGKSIPVLNAIGFANGNFYQKNGDPAFAIDKLKQATQVKKFSDPDVYINLGDAYRKFQDGGNAILSYQAALTLDPKYARANYKIGRVYQTQGQGQEPIFMKYYTDALAQDPTFSPVYETLYEYNYAINVPKSAEYLEKFLANSDDVPKACYLRASIKYAQGLFNEAITKADECIAAGGPAAYPNLYGLKAYAFDKLKDSTNAKALFEEYFKRQDSAKLGGGDYSTYALILLRFAGNEDLAAGYIDKAVALDSVEANKVTYLKAIAVAYESQKKYREAATWFRKVLSVKKNVGKTDLYYAGYDYFRAAQFDSSIAIFTMYTQKFPEDIFGYYMIGKSNAGIDSTGAQGLAVPGYQKAVEIGESAPDKEKVKVQLIGAYKFFIEYHYNVKKDRETALSFVDKAIAIDPADAQLISNRDFISKNDPKAPPKKTTAPARPAAKPKAK